MWYCYHSVNVIKFIQIDQVPNIRMSWKSLFLIIRLLLSLYLGPKVITLSGFHCISNLFSSLFDQSFIFFSFGWPYLRNTFSSTYFQVSTICQVHSLINLLYVSALVDLIWEVPFKSRSWLDESRTILFQRMEQSGRRRVGDANRQSEFNFKLLKVKGFLILWL